MISSALSFEEFVSAVADKGYLETIFLAEQEATRAERSFYSSKLGNDSTKERLKEYASILKNFIYFLRYGLEPPGINDNYWQVFISACENLIGKMRATPRCYDRLLHRRNPHSS